MEGKCWGQLPLKVSYKKNQQNIVKLKNEINFIIGEIDPQLYQNVSKKFNVRIDICGDAKGGDLLDIVFCLYS